MRAGSRVAAAALAVQILIVGFNWPVMKYAVGYASPWDFAALRTSLGAVVLFALAVFLRRPLRPRFPLYTALIGLLQTTGMFGLLLWALEQGAAGKTSVLLYTMPFWLLLMAWPLLGERVARPQFIALLLALVGLILIVDPFRAHGTLASNVIAVAAGMSWAASAIIVKRLTTRHKVDVLNLTTWQMIFGAVPLAIIAAATPSEPIVWSGGFVGALLFNIFLATALTQFLWLYVLRMLPAGTAGISTLLTPVIGVASSWAILSERPSLGNGIGMMLVILALATLTARGIVASRAAGGARPPSGPHR